MSTKVSDLFATKYENVLLSVHNISLQVSYLQLQAKMLYNEQVGLTEAMRQEVGADATAVYNPSTRTFVSAPKGTLK